MKTTFLKVVLLICSFLSICCCYSQSEEPRVLLQVEGIDIAQIKRDLPFKSQGDSSLVMDIYYPESFDFNSSIPAVLIVFGYSQNAQKKLTGKYFMNWQWYTSWSRLFTTINIAAIVYETTSPVEDLSSIQQYLQSNAADLSIDADRIALFSVSGNSGVAMDALLKAENTQQRCGVFLYPYILTNESGYAEEANEIANQYGFSLPTLPENVTWSDSKSIFLVQAGNDQIKGIKETTGEFIAKAHSVNLPLTFINYQQGIHGFDVFQDTPETKEILEDILAFLSRNLKLN